MADMKVAMIFEAVDRASAVIRGILGAQAKLNAVAGNGMAHVAAGAGRAAKGMAVAGAMVAGVAASTAAAAKALIEPGRQFERYRVQLAALEGSADKGSQALGWITDFATRTPLELDQVVESYVRLKSFGLDPTTGALQGLVDTMAANGKGAEHLDGLVIALGQAWTKGKLQGEEAMQLMERGVPVWDLLSQATGKSAAALQDMASKGKLGRDVIEQLIDVMATKYAGASDAMSKTFDGILSNLSDAWLQFQLAVNDAGLFDFMKGKAQEVLDVVKTMAADGSLATLAKTVSDTIVNVLTATWEAGKGVAAVMMTIGQGLAFVADAIGGWERLGAVIAGLALAPVLASIVAGIGQMAAGLAMIAPLILSPIGLVVAGVAAVAAAAYLLVDDWQPVLDWLAGAWDQAVAAAQEAAAWFADVWASMTPAEGWSAAITNAAADIAAGISTAAAAVGGFFQDFAAGFSGFAEPIATRFAAMGESFGRIGETLGRIGQKLATLFGGVDGARLDGFATGLGKVAGFLADIATVGLEGAVASIELLVGGIDKLLGLVTGETRLDWVAIIPPIEWGKLFDFAWADVLPDWDWSAIIPAMPDFGSWFGGESPKVEVAVETPPVPKLPATLPVADPAALREAARLTADIAASAAAIAATDTTAAMAAIGAVEAKAQAIVGGVRAALAQVEAAIAAVDLSFHGGRLMDTLAAGIRARAGVVVEAVRAVAAQVRAFLPSSPAKVGPLSDIHRLKFGETIAASIRPAPMVEAMRRAAAMTMAAAAITGPAMAAAAGAIPAAGVASPAAPSFRPPPVAAVGTASAGGVTLHAPLTVTVQGNASADVRGEIEEALREHARLLADLLDRERARRERREH